MINAYTSGIIYRPRKISSGIIVQEFLCLFNLKLNHWVFPGGKIEDGEASAAALQRELEEEIGIIITRWDLHGCFLSHIGEDKDQEWIGIFYIIKGYQGEIASMEPHKHSKLAWMTIQELREASIKNPEMGIAKYISSIS